MQSALLQNLAVATATSDGANAALVILSAMAWIPRMRGYQAVFLAGFLLTVSACSVSAQSLSPIPTWPGASPTSGRMSAPVVQYTADTVTITIGVRPLEGEQTCELGRGTPAIVTLPRPLGNRTLLDGYRYPPVEPTAPFPG